VSGVWSNGYECVLHLDEAAGDFADSSGNSRWARGDGGVTRESAGKVGYGLAFDGSDDFLAMNMSYSGAGAVPALTVSAWFNTSDSSSGSYNDNWAFVDFDRSEYYDLYVCVDAGGATDGSLGFSTTASGQDDFYGSTTGLYDGTWHYACGTFDGTTKTLYLDGSPDGTTTPPGGAFGSGITRWGLIGDGSEAGAFAIPYNSSYNNQCWFTGSLDEIRISHTTRSDDWISGQYDSMNDTLISFGAEE
jgi:hypothetical protein